MATNAMLNQTYVTKENGTETIRVFNQLKNVYFELTMNSATKEVTHYRALPLNTGSNGIKATDLMQ